MAGLVAGPVQAAAQHVGVGTAVRAAHDESVRAELERRMRPLPAGEALDGEGAAAVQSDLVLVPAAELAEAVSVDAIALGYAVPQKRARTTDDSAPRAVGLQVTGVHVMDVRKKLRRYLTELADKGEQVTMCEAADGQLYPPWQFAAAFGCWLALAPRDRRSKAALWEPDGAERMLQRSMARSGHADVARAAAGRSLEMPCGWRGPIPL